MRNTLNLFNKINILLACELLFQAVMKPGVGYKISGVLMLVVLALGFAQEPIRVRAEISPATSAVYGQKNCINKHYRKKMNWSPHWTQSGITESAGITNISFLANTQRREDGLSDLAKLGAKNIFQENEIAAIRQSYDERFRDYEFKKQFGLITLNDEYNQQKERADYSKDVLAQIRKRTYNRNMDQVRTVARKDPTLAKPVPMAMIGVATFLTADEPVRISLGAQNSVMARTSVPNKTAHLELSVARFIGKLNYFGEAEPATLDPSYDKERYRFSLLRDLPELGLSGEFFYASTSHMMGASFTRPLSEKFRLVFDTVRPATLIADVPGSRAAEETLRLLFNHSF